MGRVKQQPINDVDLLQVLLRAHLELGFVQLLVEDFLCGNYFPFFFFKFTSSVWFLNLIYLGGSYLQRLVVVSEVSFISLSHSLNHQFGYCSNI